MPALLLLLSCSSPSTKAPTDASPTDTADSGASPSGETGDGETGLAGDTDAVSYTLSEQGPPPTVPGVVLLATLIGEEASVPGFVRADVSVDLDAPEERYPFRYQVLDAASDVLYARSLPGPVQVQEYLGYYSELAGFDLLALYPELGNFALIAPLIDGAEQLVMETRGADGAWTEAGRWQYADLEGEGEPAGEAVVGWQTLWESGPPEGRLDIALVGDGYTEAELDSWREDADAVAAALLSGPPLSEYAGRINIHRIDVPSAESGASFDCVDECRFRDTAFGSVFPVAMANSILGTDYRSVAIFQRDQWAVARAVSAAPWDQVVVVANTQTIGGFSLHFATVTNGYPGWTDTAIHEHGHLLGLLGDEYVSDFCIVSEALGLPENITDDPLDPPWAHWIAPETPLPTPDGWGEVGAYEGAYNCEDLYRPAETCTMRGDDRAGFCPVCSELLVRQLFRFTDPLEGVAVEEIQGGWRLTPEGALEASVAWTLDGEPLATTAPGEALTVLPADYGAGEHLLEATATHSSPWVVEGGDDLEQRRAWTFQ